MRFSLSFSADPSLCKKLVLLAMVLAGCEDLRDLKRSLHREPPAPRPGLSRNQTGLEVSVSPADGIAIALDGQNVAVQSPFRTTSLTAGDHILEVRGMGYFPVTLPVTLAPGRMTRMPVSLRPRPPRAFTSPHAPQPDPPPRTPRASVRLPEPQPTPPSSGATRPLAQALSLHIDTRPELPLSVDGQPAQGREVVLAQSRGVLTLGTITLPYQLLVGRGLEFLIPDDEAAWYVEGRQVKVRSRLHLGRTPLYVTRQIAGTEHRITLRPIL